ncbi:DUF4186 domain-containing protein [Entomobacter blattae]|uniref:DUF4186 domain-containing protein n=1 Tax=Entomobacter blattae TaxID=2762277 RepID=A0A7H1NQR7_9PROT|nr:DUF4186 domain-containing protein [Entomobacter blattae]QNT78127.1 hypothetical protein JGUZn3_08950 [Entomobacter blattae]
MTIPPRSDPSFQEMMAQRLTALQGSAFRRKFRLSSKLCTYVQQKGIKTIEDHATTFIKQRLQPAFPPKDGKQTPYKGHPVFVAQHATATCCRSCLQKWHHIPKGQTLTDAEVTYIVAFILIWIQHNISSSQPPPLNAP